MKGDYFVKHEEIFKRGDTMVVLDVRLDNFCAFKNFHINFTYPKKIIDSYIKEEHLPDRPNFRYKKVNVFFGANASGKTTFGQILMGIFNFIDEKNYNHITGDIGDYNKEAFFALDLASDKNVFYRIVCRVLPCEDGKYGPENIKIEIQKEDIRVKDSYESCVKRLENKEVFTTENYIEELEKIKGLSWLFEYPENDGRIRNLPNKDEKFRFILENILKSLDPSIKGVKISSDVDNAYVVHFQDISKVLQNNEGLDTPLFSSGTKAGVEVAQVVWALIQGRNGFYYCDEKFSYIHSDIEKAILSIMIDNLGPYDQLFFTTHNTDILDMNLPKHTFTFLRKDVENPESPITCINASSFLKRNTDSLRSAVENDLFSSAPSIERIYAIDDSANEG